MLAGPEGEKRWTIVLSIDMVGFTEITQDIGNERTYALLQQVLDHARSSIESHGGHVIDTAGDGILAAFGAPRALENAALQSCAAALAFRQKMTDIAHNLQAQLGVKPRFRTGIAGGDAMVAHLPNDAIKVVGNPVNKAARLQALARPDEILIGDSVQREAEGFIDADPQGTVDIKGFAQPVPYFALTNLHRDLTRFDGTRRRGIVALISRRAELDHAMSALNPHTDTQIVVIRGVAGIGKSRLTHEVVSQIGVQRPTYLGQCAPDGQISFGPIYDILRQACGTDASTPAPDVLAALARRHPDICDPQTLATVLAPTDTATDALNRALKERKLLHEMLHGLSIIEKPVFVIEDAHWLDSATADLLAKLVDSPLPLIVTARPGFDPAWLDADTVCTIRLSPLSATEIGDVVNARLDSPVAPALSELIATKSEGNPLIAEEIIRALQYHDQIEETAAGLNLKEGDSTFVTGNLTHLVLSRVDRLPPHQKTQLHYAAAIGRDFDAWLLAQASGDATPLADFGGVIEKQTKTRWRFTHALIRDAVYDSLLSGQKAQIHLAIAEALEAAKAPNPQRIAEHFTLAGQPTRAVPHLLAAAKDNARVYALGAVDEDCAQALATIATDPSCVDDTLFGELAVIWMRALDSSAQFTKVREVALQVLPRLSQGGYSSTHTQVSTLYAMALSHLRDYEGALDIATSTLKTAERHDDALGAAWAKTALMRVYEETYCQPPDVVERLAEEIMPIATAHEDRHLGMTALYLLSSVYRSSGQRRKALATSDRIATFARTFNDQRARGFSNWVKAIVYTVEGDAEAVRRITEVGRADVLPGTSDDYAWSGVAMFATILLESPDVAFAKLGDLDRMYASTGDYNLLHSATYMRAALLLKNGQLAAGWRILNSLITDAEAKGNVNITRQVRQLRAEVLLTISGLIDPQAEVPADRPTFPRKKPRLADITTYVKMKLAAQRLINEDLKRCIALDPLQHGAHFARCKIGLGLLAAKKGEKDVARRHIIAGRDSAETEGLTLLVARADRALEQFKL